MAKILAIGAHPDDIEFYAGGTLAKRADEGDEVVIVVATDGRNGSYDGIKPVNLAKIRRREQDRAAQVIGAKKVVHLGFADGSLEDNVKKLKIVLLQLLIEERPEIVFTFDPQKQYILHEDFHPDHRVLAVAALDVILIDSNLPLKAKIPLQRPRIFLYNCYQANEKVEVAGHLLKKKAALKSFKSQVSRLKLNDIGFEEFQVY